MLRRGRRAWWPAISFEAFPALDLTAEELLGDLDPGFAAGIAESRRGAPAGATEPETRTRELGVMSLAQSKGLLRATWLAARLSATVSRRLAEPFAARLWFTPWPTPATASSRRREAAWLSAAAPLQVRLGPGRLAGFAAGAGPVVLLVHGWGDTAARMGAFIEPLTTAGYRVVAFDLPAHGRSAGAQTDLYALASAVRAAAQDVGARAVVAHSLGGAATVLALREGLELDAVVLIATPVRLERAVASFAGLFRLPPAAVTALQRRLERRFGADVWQALRADATAATLRVPALVVHDRDDGQVAVEDGVMLAHAWSGAELVVTDGLGHSRILRNRDVLNRVAGFLGRTVGPDPTAARSRSTRPDPNAPVGAPPRP